jgi:hypothetical protein
MAATTSFGKRIRPVLGLVLGLAWLCSLGCATAPRPKRLPALPSLEERQAYYAVNCIQQAEGLTVTVAGEARDTQANGANLDYRNARGRVVRYAPPTPASVQIRNAWLDTPAVGLVGVGIGSVIWALNGMNFAPHEVPEYWPFAVGGFGAGVLLGAAVAAIQMFTIPAAVERMTRERAEKYNRALWRDLELGVIPYDKGEALRLKLRF